jgi:hypothetical protein
MYKHKNKRKEDMMKALALEFDKELECWGNPALSTPESREQEKNAALDLDKTRFSSALEYGETASCPISKKAAKILKRMAADMTLGTTTEEWLSVRREEHKEAEYSQKAYRCEPLGTWDSPLRSSLQNPLWRNRKVIHESLKAKQEASLKKKKEDEALPLPQICLPGEKEPQGIEKIKAGGVGLVELENLLKRLASPDETGFILPYEEDNNSPLSFYRAAGTSPQAVGSDIWVLHNPNLVYVQQESPVEASPKLHVGFSRVAELYTGKDASETKKNLRDAKTCRGESEGYPTLFEVTMHHAVQGKAYILEHPEQLHPYYTPKPYAVGSIPERLAERTITVFKRHPSPLPNQLAALYRVAKVDCYDLGTETICSFAFNPTPTGKCAPPLQTEYTAKESYQTFFQAGWEDVEERQAKLTAYLEARWRSVEAWNILDSLTKSGGLKKMLHRRKILRRRLKSLRKAERRSKLALDEKDLDKALKIRLNQWLQKKEGNEPKKSLTQEQLNVRLLIKSPATLHKMGRAWYLIKPRVRGANLSICPVEALTADNQEEMIQEAFTYCTEQGKSAFKKAEKILKGGRESFSGKDFTYDPIIDAANISLANALLDEWGIWKVKRDALLMAGAKVGKKRNYGWSVDALRLPAAYVAPETPEEHEEEPEENPEED